jgi:kynurenine formamidase
MPRRLIDLSIAIENGVESDPPGAEPKITYFSHKQTTQQLTSFFPGLTAEQLPSGESWAVEQINLSTHNGTHMDAPYHFHSTQDEALPGGSRASMTIDEVPLDWCWQPGLKLDFRHLEDGYVVTRADIEAELDRIGHTLRPLDIVLVNTRAGSVYGRKGYVAAGCGMGREATLFLASSGVKIVGTDGWSWDAPFVHTAKRWAATGDASIIWEGHKAGREIGYCQIEKLHNLESVPSTGFDMMCFPVKIRDAGAGWIRAVAVVHE